MANENSKTQPQLIPLSKIHDLPGVFIPKPQDKALGSMVLSIQNSGVKEAVVLRQRDDGEYQLLSGYRRRRASELAQKQDIPALVYEMTLQEAIAYTKAVREKPDTPVPGKLIDPSAEKAKTAEAAPPVAGKDDKANQDKAHAEATDKGKDDKANAAPSDKGTQGEAPTTPEDKTKPDKAPTAPEDKAKDDKAPAIPEDKTKPDKATAALGDKTKKDETPAAPKDEAKDDKAPAAPEDKAKKDEAPAVPKDKAQDGKAPTTPEGKAKGGEAPAAPTVAELEAKVKAGERIPLTELAAAGKAEREAKTQTASAGKDKPGKSADADKGKDTGVVLTAASEGPAGTSITQIFDKRLDPPDEAARKSLPTPKEGESYFITLHPAYLEKSTFNNFSVDIESENFKELLKSVELVGIKDPVLARFTPEGKLEILSGQRRHIAAIMLNQAVPTIIQKIDDADAKIIVADGNLHRDKITSYDLSRALRMKMEGMKQKAGRRKKGYSANELQSDAKLAQEMGMSVAKLNRIIHLSEAVKGVCDLVDSGNLTISVASEMAYLKPQTQESVLHLLGLGYKATNERISRMKKAESGGKKLDEMDMRSILDDKDIAPKQPEPVKQPEAPSAPAEQPPIPASPDVPEPAQASGTVPPPASEPTAEQPSTVPPAPSTPEAPREDDPFKGGQERAEVTKVILTGDRLRKYFPDVTMTPREIEDSVYSALEERRQRQLKEQQKAGIFKKSGGATR